MGKQIRFYIDRELEKDLIHFVIANGGEILFEGENLKPISVTSLPEPFSGKGWFTSYLYKADFGELKYISLPNKRLVIDSTKSPVIEFSRTIIRSIGKNKEISGGRFWLEMKYWNGENQLVQKPVELDQWYKALSKWIKEHVPKDKESNSYVSPAIKDLLARGFKLM
ncbi:hypothetical protein WQ57_21145 [Mesobacillus campisalis]|uniref:Uncharacterized protein n=1 Tax=Mesobacillus campisalis TaxID=1408103 RepID=A0A0M2SPE4_9BACI|nr:hypothetical protein [Mesobacillus campisalis]KKK36118.1 hypothetical protein WQ57_21145 [Mesobacillus campisalis]